MTITKRITAGLKFIPAVFLAFACDTGGAESDEALFYTGEAQCSDTALDSPTDKACHEDCVRNCGFNGSPNYPRAQKYCICQGGVYIECRCPRPDWYKGAIFAPYCDSLTADGLGISASLDDMPCEREWDQCIGRDIVDGYTPRGAVCLDTRGNGQLTWVAGSTEKWFAPEQSVRP